MNNVTKNITFDSDRVYRWVYELNLYKNPTILFLIWKIFGFVLLGIWLFMVILEIIDDNLSLDTLMDITSVFLLLALGFGLLCLIGYLLYALMMGGKYCVLFEMDDRGVHHIQMESQIKKVEAISILTRLVGAMAGRPGVVGTGMLAGARTSMYTAFADVKSVEFCPGRDLIKVNELLNKNQVYAEDEDFDFVLNFIRAHTKS
jgi:hypothetical protein